MSLSEARLSTDTRPNDLEAYWMPFTPNRAFKKAPRLITRAKDMYYYAADGRAVLDATAGLWCCNAGHGREEIVTAIKRQAEELDYAPAFQFAHPYAFELASRVAALAPGDLDHVFFCNSGSEAVDTALKIALAYHHVRGEGARTRLIGRERGYHGVGFGGISVGGIVANRKLFGTLLAGVDHLPATYNREHQAFSKGEPEWGAHLADELERIIALHDASTIAAVIVEPMAGSTGVLPAPKGYLQRLRAICDKYGILLILDEVITGFGRLGHAFAAERYGVRPDLAVLGKAIANGFPLAVVGGRADLMAGVARTWISSTLATESVALAAAQATLEVFAHEDVCGHLHRMGTRLLHGLHRLHRKHADLVTGVGGIAEMCFLHFASENISRDVARGCAARGLLFKRTAYNFVSLAHDEETIDRTLETLGEVLAKAEEET